MDLERFGQMVYERRLELGLTQQEVADNGGPTDTTLGKIENGEWAPGNRQVTLRRLDAGLFWEPGSAKRALSGDNPTPLDAETAALRRHFRIMRKPESERTSEDRAFLQSERDAFDRRVQASVDQALGSPPFVVTPHDQHFERAERLLRHSHESVRQGEYLGAIHGLEGLESTVELLINRISQAAVQDRRNQENVLKTGPHSDVSGEASEPVQESGTSEASPHNSEPGLTERLNEAAVTGLKPEVDDGDNGTEQVGGP